MRTVLTDGRGGGGNNTRLGPTQTYKLYAISYAISNYPVRNDLVRSARGARRILLLLLCPRETCSALRVSRPFFLFLPPSPCRPYTSCLYRIKTDRTTGGPDSELQRRTPNQIPRATPKTKNKKIENRQTVRAMTFSVSF